MRFISASKLLIILLLALWAGKGYSAIVVDSVVAARSNCANDGTITTYATSPSAMLYAIVTGPDIRPKQSGNQFGGLPAGAYQVMVTNFSNDTATVSVTVTGNYTFPDFAPTFKDPFCPGDASGVIVGNALNKGKAPFTWVLTDLATNISTTQPSDSFKNLPAGNYKLQQLDSCQSFATRYVTLSDLDHTFRITSINNRMFKCDSVRLMIQLFVTNGNFARPYTIKIDTKNGSYQHVITNISYSGWYPELAEVVGGVTYGDYVNVTITDACGNSFYKPNTLTVFNPTYNFTGVFDSCKLKYKATFGLVPITITPSYNPTTFHLPVYIKATNPTTGAFIDSVKITDTSGYSFPIMSPALLPGQLYRINIRDECGNNYTRDIQWPVQPTPTFSKKITSDHCRDSTAQFEAHWKDFYSSRPVFELLSGPTTIGSTKSHFTYTDTIAYPQKITAGQYSTGTGSIDYGVEITNFGPGTYHYRVYDTCGNSITDSFTITKANVGSDSYMLSYIKGCPGQNSIALTYDVRSNAQLHNNNYGNKLFTKTPRDTIRNLNFDWYLVSLNYYSVNNPTKINNKGCQIIWDTIYIPPYEQPLIAYATQTKCNGTVNVGLQPDSSKGVPPYKYEIISGPQTAAVQPSNFFKLTQPGTYVARISDTCGFARTFTFYVDTLAFKPIVKIGPSCAADSALLIAEHSPYAKYIWTRPNGSTYTGDTLRMKPVLATDYGTYYISKIVSVNNCTDTIKGIYTLTFLGTSYHYDTVCAGRSIVFRGNTYSQPGTYYDTIPTAQCDSVIVFRLSQRPTLYRYAFDSVCAGYSMVFLGKTYTQQGTYYDTIQTIQCDTVVVFQLSYKQTLYRYAYDTICPGRNSVFNGNTYTQQGVYYDTVQGINCDTVLVFRLTFTPTLFSVEMDTICAGQSLVADTHVLTVSGSYSIQYKTAGGCDSFRIIVLYVRPALKDSVARTICPGQSVTVGSNTYSTTGVYRDTLSTAGGCDSIYILNLQVVAGKRDSVARTICTGQSITIGSNTYSTTGIYRDTISTPGGCDSIQILNLTVNSAIKDSVAQTLCYGSQVTVGTNTYSSTGIYYDTLSSVGGCDSIHILHLTINAAIKDSVIQYLCQGQSISVGSHTYSTTGIYRDTLTAANGCDSVHILNLTVYPSIIDSEAVTICAGQSITVGPNTYYATGMYRDTFYRALCDSIHILNLTVTAVKQDSVVKRICFGQSVTVGTNTYSTTGIYRHTLQSTGGCDSIYILDLRVETTRRDSVARRICGSESITVGSNTYNSTGIYYDTLQSVGGCDSIHILNLQVVTDKRDTLRAEVCTGMGVAIDGKTYTQPGIYTDTFATAGCDSIRTVIITVHALPQLQLSASNTTMAAGDTVQLSSTANSAYTYQWQPAGAMSNPAIHNPIGTINQSTWIRVQVSDTNGCIATDSVFIAVVECFGNIYVPNVFSPNNDGANDEFRVYGNCIMLNSLKVFNRWGEKVWETNDITAHWDGYYRGELQQPGVFVYLLSYFNTATATGKAKQLKGSLTLIR